MAWGNVNSGRIIKCVTIRSRDSIQVMSGGKENCLRWYAHEQATIISALSGDMGSQLMTRWENGRLKL